MYYCCSDVAATSCCGVEVESEAEVTSTVIFSSTVTVSTVFTVSSVVFSIDSGVVGSVSDSVDVSGLMSLSFTVVFFSTRVFSSISSATCSVSSSESNIYSSKYCKDEKLRISSLWAISSPLYAFLYNSIYSSNPLFNL